MNGDVECDVWDVKCDTIETAFFIIYQKISGTSGKNHFHEMNGDVGMAGWR